MDKSLTGTRNFGFSASWLANGIAQAAANRISTFRNDAELAQRMGIGTVQLEALGAWMRFAGLVDRSLDGVRLTRLGRCIHDNDPSLADPATWWVLHWELAHSYTVWAVLAGLPAGFVDVTAIESALQAAAPEVSDRTIKNARAALMRALEDTPLGQELGIVHIEYDGERLNGLTKLTVRHGQVPMAAVAYALTDWSIRESMPSAALDSLAAAAGPGPVLHMSEGAIERYLTEIDGAFRGQVLSYSRTAGLNEGYFRQEILPLQLLLSHYMCAREGLAWTEALARAREELAGEHETDCG